MAVMAVNECSVQDLAGQMGYDAALEKARRERRHALILPREHGQNSAGIQ
jgi:hypothetical protein